MVQKGEELREAASTGDEIKLKEMLTAADSTLVNSQNPMNGWQASQIFKIARFIHVIIIIKRYLYSLIPVSLIPDIVAGLGLALFYFIGNP